MTCQYVEHTLVPDIPWTPRNPSSPEDAIRKLEHILSVAKFADGIDKGVRAEASMCLTALWDRVLLG